MCTVTVNKLDRLALAHNCRYTGTDNTYGHRSYVFEKTGNRVIFKYNPRTRRFYLRDPDYPRNNGYVNHTKSSEIHTMESIENLIKLAILKNDLPEFYTIYHYNIHKMRETLLKIAEERLSQLKP